MNNNNKNINLRNFTFVGFHSIIEDLLSKQQQI